MAEPDQPNENVISEVNDNSVEGPRRITLRKILAYAAGILAILNFIGALAYSIYTAALLFVIASVVSLPPVKRNLEQEFNIDITTPAAIGIYLIVTVVGNILIFINLLS